MPYIKKGGRQKALNKQMCAGELNYTLTELFLKYTKDRGGVLPNGY